MTQILMPKATAVWLIDNTTLTFDQIADFTGLHPLEIQGIADGEVAKEMHGADPVVAGQLAAEEIKKGEADPAYRLLRQVSQLPAPVPRTKGPRYVPVSKRGDKPDAIAWLIRNHPELTDNQVGRMLGTTKTTINAVRNRTHVDAANIKPRSPVQLGLVTQIDLDAEIARALEARDKAAAAAGLPKPPEAEPLPPETGAPQED